jgi:DNA polymerase III delta subunit
LSFLKKFSPLAKVEEFRLPKSVFAFLESFVPGGSGRCLKLLHGQLEKEAPEFIFALLGKHVRDLYWVKVAPESLEYPTWRVSKLAKQAKAFSEEKLQKTLNSLAKIDFSAKTSSQDLSSLLDLLIVTQLQ